MTMSDEGRKIWNSPAGVHLLKTWGLGTEETPEDRETINRLKELNRKRGIVPGNAAADKSGREPDSVKKGIRGVSHRTAE